MPIRIFGKIIWVFRFHAVHPKMLGAIAMAGFISLGSAPGTGRVSGKEHTDLHAFTFEGLAEVVDSLKDRPVYFTVDLDVMDPSVFPGTGTPEPGGVSFEELRRAVTLVCQKANVVGTDANELSPHYDKAGRSRLWQPRSSAKCFWH